MVLAGIGGIVWTDIVTVSSSVTVGIGISNTTSALTGIGLGWIKVTVVKIVARKDGPILGATVVDPIAGEIIHELMYSVGWEALPSEAAAFIHAHPTISEGIGETLLAAAKRPLH